MQNDRRLEEIKKMVLQYDEDISERNEFRWATVIVGAIVIVALIVFMGWVLLVEAQRSCEVFPVIYSNPNNELQIETTHQPKSSTPPPFTITTANVAMLPYNLSTVFHGFPTSKKHGKQVGQLITHYLKDSTVLCIQEAMDHVGCKEIVRHLNQMYPFVISTCPKRISAPTGIILASKLPVISAQYERFADAGLPDSWASKGFLIVKLQWSAMDLVVYNTHLESGNRPQDRKIRIQQLNQLLQHVRKFQSHESLVLVVGDLNVEDSNHPDYEFFFSQFDPMTQFPASLDFVLHYKTDHRRHEAVESFLRCSEFKFCKPFHSVSDHLPLTAVFEMQKSY